eukprot:101571-Pelagomonas_calceolata.AAC.1
MLYACPFVNSDHALRLILCSLPFLLEPTRNMIMLERLLSQNAYRALHLAPWSAALWSQRAEALLSRGWAGDAMWALRDCDVCLAIDPCFWQARLQRGRALKAMGQIKDAPEAQA